MERSSAKSYLGIQTSIDCSENIKNRDKFPAKFFFEPHTFSEILHQRGDSVYGCIFCKGHVAVCHLLFLA